MASAAGLPKRAVDRPARGFSPHLTERELSRQHVPSCIAGVKVPPVNLVGCMPAWALVRGIQHERCENIGTQTTTPDCTRSSHDDPHEAVMFRLLSHLFAFRAELKRGRRLWAGPDRSPNALPADHSQDHETSPSGSSSRGLTSSSSYGPNKARTTLFCALRRCFPRPPPSLAHDDPRTQDLHLSDRLLRCSRLYLVWCAFEQPF